MTILISVTCGVLVFLMFVFFIEYTRRSRTVLRQRMRFYADGMYLRDSMPEAQQARAIVTELFAVDTQMR